MKSVPYYELSDSELDKLIQDNFSKPSFQCVPCYEWHNDTSYTGTVSIAEIEKDGLEKDELQEFIDQEDVGLYPCHWSILLSELARRGIVPEGRYIISVCW